MRKKWITGNWKMYHTLAKAALVIDDLKRLVPQALSENVVLFVPSTLLQTVTMGLEGTLFSVGGQNCYPQNEGAFTGEISPMMLKDAGCRFVLVGHSERRTYFLENDDFLNQKMVASIASGLIPVLCVGETLAQREAGEAFAVVQAQLEGGLKDLPSSAEIKVAYEPVWAIGTGKVASQEEAQEVHAHIRQVLASMGLNAEKISILYGGSVKPENAVSFLSQADIDGVLVGGASLEAESFAKIISSLETIKMEGLAHA